MKHLITAFIATSACLTTLNLPSVAQAKVIKAEVWADNPDVSSVSLSPDGKNLAMLQRTERGGQYQVVTFNTDNPSATMQRLDTGRLVPTRVNWANSDVILVNMYEEAKVGKDINRVGRILAFNVRTKKSLALLDGKRKSKRSGGSVNAAVSAIGQGGLVNLLPKDPKNVMMQFREDAGAPNYYKVDVYTGDKELMGKGNDRYGGFGFDDDGELRTGSTLEPDGPRIVSLARPKGRDNWVTMGEQDARKRGRYNLFGFYDMARPNIALAASDSPGGNNTKIYEQDVSNPSAKRVVYEKPGYDVGSPLTSPRMKDGRKVVGYTYHSKKREEYDYTDPELRNIYASIEGSFPNDNIFILDVSDDNQTTLFVVSGPQNAGEYYMIKNGKAAKVATRYAEIDKASLSPQRLVNIKARDGREVPTLVTVPKGAGPHKAIALPHGGPWSRDTYGFDTWAQMLANRGYAVVQPQFRGSTDLGLDHWMAGDNQWGLAMQDDVEDAMLELAKQGLIDRDKMGIFGWSFGGYTTNVAITRGNDIFKCAVSGAGISDVTQIAGGLSGSRFLRQYQKPTISGYSPINHVEKANMPVMVVHGNLDRTVDVRQSRRFVDKLKDADKDVKFIQIKNMYHNPATATRYKDYMTFYPAMFKFLDTKCGF